MRIPGVTTEEPKRQGTKPDGVRAWIDARLRREQWAYRLMAAALAPVAIAVAAVAYLLIYFVIDFAFRSSPAAPAEGEIAKASVEGEDRGGSGFLGHLAAATVMVGTFALARRSTAPPWASVRVRGEEVNTLVRVSQMTGTGWLVLLQSDRDLPGPIRAVVDVVTFPPRLVQLVAAIVAKSFDIDGVDSARLGKLVTVLLNARGRVALFELVERFPDADPQELVDELATVEGVVFLTNDPPGATLTPMVADEYIEWRAKKREEMGLEPAADDVKWRST